MEGSTANGVAPAPPHARCVLWHDPAAGPAAAATVGQLETRLRDRGVGVIRAGTAPAALAELCVLSRESRATPGGGGPLSIIVVEPRKREESRALARAVARYVPYAVVWAFETEPVPVLRPAPATEVEQWPGGPTEGPQVVVTASDIQGAGSFRNAGEPVARAGRPFLRLAGDSGGPRAGPQATDEDTTRPDPGGTEGRRALLTQEELAMLLAEDEPSS